MMSEIKLNQSFDIDKIQEFKAYFPFQNFDSIIRQYNKIKLLQKGHSHRRGMVKSEKSKK